MTSRKAQGLGFIIVLIISIFAVVGVVVGTVQVWNSMACVMGAPLRLSFAPHVGNLKARTVLIEQINFEDSTFDECFTSCSDELTDPNFEWDTFLIDGETQPSLEEIEEICYTICLEFCPPNQTCKKWDLNITYIGGTEITGDNILLQLYNKPNRGSYDFSRYIHPIESQEYSGIEPGTSFISVVSSAYVDKGEIVGFGPHEFFCENGSFIKIDATANNQIARIEQTTAHAFCLVPKIIVGYTRNGNDVDFNVTTNYGTNCYFAIPSFPNDFIPMNTLINGPHTFHVSSSNTGIGDYKFLCSDLLEGINSPAAEVWVSVV